MQNAPTKFKANRLGVVIVIITIAGAILPFMTYRANRIVSGFGKSLVDSLPLSVSLAVIVVLLSFCFVALFINSPYLRLSAGIALLIALALAAGFTRDLIPAGNKFARVAFASGFWLWLFAAVLLCADAFAKLQLGPWARVLGVGLAGISVMILLWSGQWDHLSIMREYATHADSFLPNVQTHLLLAFGSVFIAIVIGVPLGIVAFRHRKVRVPVLQMLNLVQTIPSIALFGLVMGPLAYIALHVPYAADLGVAGIGFFPAFVALTLYSLLPIVANTIVGLRDVPTATVEAARGMGMTKWHTLTGVEIPLAMPALLAGIRIVLVQNIGLATVAALIGGGGFGTYVFQGLGQSAIDLVLLGAAPTIAFAFAAAIILDASIELMQGGKRD